MDVKAYIESGIIESFVLGLTSPEETAEVQAMMLTHPEVAVAVNDFSASLEKHAFANATAPPSSVKKNLFDSLEDEFKSAPAPVVQLRQGQKNTWKYLAAASVILFIASAAMNVYYYNSYHNMQSSYENLLAEQSTMQANINIMQTKLHVLDTSMEMIKDPAMAVVPMKGIPGKEDNMATVYWDTHTKDVYVLENKLPQAPAGMQYQLWAIVDGKPVNAGMLGDCNGGLCKMKNIPKAQMFAITLEKEGGSPAPNMQAMYVAGKVS
ncbi:MAG: anti-sigma factor [Chitinophagaceae bacterium]|nr:anti-sigma factor [Chitinophagaceae bacterium]